MGQIIPDKVCLIGESPLGSSGIFVVNPAPFPLQKCKENMENINLNGQWLRSHGNLKILDERRSS